MKKLLTLLFAVISCVAIGQTKPPQTIGNKDNIVKTLGQLAADSAFLMPKDTIHSLQPTDRAIAFKGNYVYKWTGYRWDYFLIGADTLYVDSPLRVRVDSSFNPPHRILFILKANGLESGGIVTKAACLQIGVTPSIYNIGFKQYSTPDTVLTVATPDISFPRTDEVVVDTLGHIYILTGVPSATPTPITTNPSSQIVLSTYTVAAGATCLPINVKVIYDQDSTGEFTHALSGAASTIAFANTDNPQHLTKATFISSFHNGAKITFTDAGLDTVQLGEVIKHFFYFNGAFGGQIQEQFFLNSAAVSNNVVINPYFNPNDSNRYITAVIPLSVWNFTTRTNPTFNKIVITLIGNDTSGAKGFYFDYLQLQTGLSNINIAPVTVYDFTKTTARDSIILTLTDGTRFAVKDSVGSGGGSGGTQALSSVLINGNSTQRQYIFNDSVATASGSGATNFQLKPQNYNTTYGLNARASLFQQSYGYYPGVNFDARPNVVLAWASYNGAFNSPLFANEPTWSFRGETHFTPSPGVSLNEFHLPEFKDSAGNSRRINSYYVNSANGSTSQTQQIDSWTMYQGRTDTPNVAISAGVISFYENTNGHLTFANSRKPQNVFDISLGDAGSTIGATGFDTANTRITFGVPGLFTTTPTFGANYAALQVNVTKANYPGIQILPSGIGSSDYKGIYELPATTGIYDALKSINLSAGTSQISLAGQGGKMQYQLWDYGSGRIWNMAMTSGGTPEYSLRFGIDLDSALLIRGNTGFAKFKYNLGIGTAEPTARFMVPAPTATAGTGQIKFVTGTLPTTPEIGLMNMSNGLWFLDSSNSVRDTISTRRWARNNIAGSGGAFVALDGSTPLTANWNAGAFTLESRQTAGTANTNYDGLIASNTGTASSGNQMYSPSLILEGRSWNTTASASQAHRWRIWNQTIQNNSAAGTLTIDANGNGGAYTNFLTIPYSTGVITAPFGFSTSSGVSNFSTTTFIGLTTMSRYKTSGVALGYIAKTANYTATTTDYTIECTANTFTVTLPTAVGISGTSYVITNSGAGVITVATTSSQTFVNVTATPTTLTLNQFNTTTLQSNGANWLRLTNL